MLSIFRLYYKLADKLKWLIFLREKNTIAMANKPADHPCCCLGPAPMKQLKNYQKGM